MRLTRWVLALLIAAAVGGTVYCYFRASYGHSKRLREVTPGRFYRSGQLTASGFADAFGRYKIKTVINLQEEARDPLLPAGYLGEPGELESDVCKRFGVAYVSLDGGVLDDPAPVGNEVVVEPKLLTDFYRVLDDPNAYPVLIHCKAGLHRTGFLTAVYRMEFEDRRPADAMRELRGNGFGTFAGTEANLYVRKYILEHRPRKPVSPAGASR